MTEMVIENGIVIDDVESVLCGIRELSNQKLDAIETIKKFIVSEKNTKFYVDNKLMPRDAHTIKKQSVNSEPKTNSSNNYNCRRWYGMYS